MRRVFYWVLGIALALALGVVGTLYHGTLAELDTPMPAIPVEVAEPEAPRPPSLDDLQVTSIRVGMDVTLLLDWERKNYATPFHIWVEVDGSQVVLYSPGSEPRRIEVVPEAELLFYGSTLYHEHNDNRLVIDLQVKNDG